MTPTAYLCGVHLILPHHLDSHLVELSIVVLGTVDVAEGAIAHLLEQSPSFEAGVFGQLAFAGSLFGYYAFEYLGVVVLLLLISLLLLVDGFGGSMSGLGSNSSVIDCGDREVTLGGVGL